MNILYLSCHSILEYDEVRLLTELGYNVFSIGAYSNPAGDNTLPRPSIPNLKFYSEFFDYAVKMQSSENENEKNIIPDELISWSDVIIYMHMPEQLARNWKRIKHKRVIFRSIGQNTQVEEDILRPLHSQGLEIIRYSPLERNIPNFSGEDHLIRFYKDPDEYGNWNGQQSQAINITQKIKSRHKECFYNEIQYMLWNFPNKIYGMGNDNLGDQWGGFLSTVEHQKVLQDNRCFVYGGTHPASYTLSFIEALMTGIPIVAIGKGPARSHSVYDYYEIPHLLINNENGFFSNDLWYLRDVIENLLINHDFAQKISNSGRELAVELFGKKNIASQWKKLISY